MKTTADEVKRWIDQCRREGFWIQEPFEQPYAVATIKRRYSTARKLSSQAPTTPINTKVVEVRNKPRAQGLGGPNFRYITYSK